MKDIAFKEGMIMLEPQISWVAVTITVSTDPDWIYPKQPTQEYYFFEVGFIMLLVLSVMLIIDRVKRLRPSARAEWYRRQVKKWGK